MNFTDYQKDLIDKIYRQLVETSNSLRIKLEGEAGSGKTTIVFGLAGFLQEDWKVFYIKGIYENVAPYLTWHLGTKLYSKTNFDFSEVISFGVNYPPVNIGVTLNPPKLKKTNYILTSNEEALLSNIEKQAGNCSNILLIIEDYELWDKPSKDFLNKLLYCPDINLLSKYRLNVICTSKTTPDSRINWDTYTIPCICNEDCYFILNENNIDTQLNISDIRAYTGNDISLMLMAAKYYNASSTLHHGNIIKDILDLRYKSLSEEEKDVCTTLEPLSIINSFFSNKEAACFLSDKYDDYDEAMDLAENHLDLACVQKIIIGSQHFSFINQEMREYFRDKIQRREKFYHKKFANYLKVRHPEDYFNRGNHVKLSLLKNSENNICEAWQLLFLAYIRRFQDLQKKDAYEILPEIDSLISELNAMHQNAQFNAKKHLLTAYDFFAQYDYRNTILSLQKINLALLIPALKIECQCLILLCQVALADNLPVLTTISDELYHSIGDEHLMEDEQYCRSALVLMEIYRDRCVNRERARELKNKFEIILSKHLESLAFMELQACYDRKSALYYAAIVAVERINLSVQFYKNHSNPLGLYLSRCNHAANSIIIGDYENANNSIEECSNLIRHHERMIFPSIYKVQNNKILFAFLKEETYARENKKQYLLLLCKTAQHFHKIMNDLGDEVSHVIYLNYLALSMLGNINQWKIELSQANERLKNIDPYYEYYLGDLNLANAILNKDFQEAQNELLKLRELDVPLLHSYAPIFERKRLSQEQIINSEIDFRGDAIAYNEKILKECAHTQDPSCYFYGRGLLLSDLQFLSL